MKKILILCLSVVMVFSLAACTSSSTGEEQSSMVYKNETYGFQFEVPESWTGNYEIKESVNEGDYPDKLRVDVLFSPEKLDESMNKMPLVSFIVVEKAYWDEFDSSEYPPMGDYIGEKGDYVILVAGPQSPPYDSGTKEGQMFDEMSKDTGALRDSFEIM